MRLATPFSLALLAVCRLASASPISNAADLIADLQRRQGDRFSGFTPRAQVFGPTWSGWDNATARWSTYSAPTFDLVFIPQTENDLTTGLKYMSANNVPFLAQGGGHGYSPTLGIIQDAVMINLRNFKTVKFNADNSLVVGGAAVFSDIYAAAYARGRELTLGSCPCVGAMGASLGGGHGRLQGKHAMSADALLKVRLALYNGTIVEASKTQNTELFWGLRGAGHNYGVVISATFATYPQTNGGRHYNADMVFTKDSVGGVVDAINKIIPNQDAGLALDLIFFSDPTTLEAIPYLNLVYAGPQAQGEQYANLFKTVAASSTTKPITRLSNNASMVTWDQLPYVSAGGAIAAACAKGLRQNTYAANLAKMDVSKTVELFNSYQTFVKANPLAAPSLILYEIFGQAALVAAPDTAAANRKYAKVLALVEMAYSDDAVATAADTWAKGWRNTLIKPEVSGYDKTRVYQNYAHGDEPLQALYGYEPERLNRLGKLKAKYDPKNFFKGYHAVPAVF